MVLFSNFLAFVLGGVLLPPLLLVTAFVYLSIVLPKYLEKENGIEKIKLEDKDDISEFSSSDDSEYENFKLTEKEEESTTGVKAFRSGWITVTKEYHTFASNATEKPIETKESKSAYTALYRLVKKKTSNPANEINSQAEPVDEQHLQTTTATGDPKASSRRKNRYYGILRHGNLFLYKDESLKNVRHVIVLSNHFVTLWPRTLTDGELFTKRSAICILKKTPRRKSDLPPKSSSASLKETTIENATADIIENGHSPEPNSGFFIYCDTNYDKEDWYFELIKATKRKTNVLTGTELDELEPNIYANTLHFKTADMISLIQTLHSSEGQMYTRWFNALVGRIFLAVQGTEFFENVVRDRLIKKLSKINRPGFLDEFKIKKIDVGTAAPVISHPKLQELNPDGSLRIGLRFSYRGKISIQIATIANINLGSHFKTREVNILLALTVNKIDGPLAIKIKPPPSSRLWYTFEKNPDMEFTVEPVVSQRQITYSMITKAIESKLKDSINESLVEPAWDDINFWNSNGEIYRGGIWDTSNRPGKSTTTDTANDPDLISDGLDEMNAVDIEDNQQPQLDTHTTDADIESCNTMTSTHSSNKTFSDDENDSIRSKKSNSIKEKTSYSNFSIKSKKSEARTQISTEQFLSNGDYVLKEPQSESGSIDNDSIRSNDSGSTKKTISSSLKKMGKWYNEKANLLRSPPTSKDSKEYCAPEMIQSRRRTSSSISGTGSTNKIKPPSAQEDNQPNSAVDLRGSLTNLKLAPQAHSFPPEYLFGLNNTNPNIDHETKSTPPVRIAQMRSPYEFERKLPTVLQVASIDENTAHQRKIPDRKKPPGLEVDCSSNESNGAKTEEIKTGESITEKMSETSKTLETATVYSIRRSHLIDETSEIGINQVMTTMTSPETSSVDSEHQLIDFEKQESATLPALPPRFSQESHKLENTEEMSNL